MNFLKSSNKIGSAKNLGLLFSLTAIFSTSVFGQLTQNITIGNPKALSLGHAVTADPPGIDSIHFNPAGLALLRDRQYQLKLLTAQMTFDAKFSSDSVDFQGNSLTPGETEDPLAGQSSNTSAPSLMLPVAGLTDLPALALPLGGFSYAPEGLPFTFATSVYSPMGVGYNRKDDDPGRFQGKEASLVRITYLSPSVAYRINDSWSVGASYGMSWQGMGANFDIRAPHVATDLILDLCNTIQANNFAIPGLCVSDVDTFGPYSEVGNLSFEVSDAMSPSFNVGVLWQPNDWFSWGLTYQSESEADMDGEFFLAYHDDWAYWGNEEIQLIREGLGSVGGDLIFQNLPEGIESQGGDVSLKIKNPAHIATGVSVAVTPRVTVNFDVKWTDYSVWDEFRIEFSEDIDFLRLTYLVGQATNANYTVEPDVLRLDRGYVATTSWALGMKFRYSDNIELRGGYEDRPSAIPADKQDLMLPLGDADLFTFGFGYRVDSITYIDMAVAYLTSEANVGFNSSTNTNSIGADNLVYNPYAGLAYNTSTTATLFTMSYRTVF